MQTFFEQIEAPDVYVFTQIDHPLFPIFAHGTIRDLQTTISEPARQKLMLLSLITAISEGKRSYSELMNSLMLSSVEDLESLFICAVYKQLLRGKLNQRKKQVQIDSFVARNMDKNIILKKVLKFESSIQHCLKKTKDLKSSLLNF